MLCSLSIVVVKRRAEVALKILSFLQSALEDVDLFTTVTFLVTNGPTED